MYINMKLSKMVATFMWPVNDLKYFQWNSFRMKEFCRILKLCMALVYAKQYLTDVVYFENGKWRISKNKFICTWKSHSCYRLEWTVMNIFYQDCMFLFNMFDYGSVCWLWKNSDDTKYIFLLEIKNLSLLYI